MGPSSGPDPKLRGDVYDDAVMFVVSRAAAGISALDIPRPGLICSSGPMTAARIALLLGAGAVAGIVGSAGGTASLIAYPALLAAGIAPLPADVTLSVAFVAAWPGSALGSRPELRGQGHGCGATRRSPQRAARLAPRCCLSPRDVFGRVVPFLLAFAALTLLLQPQISAWLARRRASSSRFLLPGALIAVSAYDGYWGAGRASWLSPCS